MGTEFGHSPEEELPQSMEVQDSGAFAAPYTVFEGAGQVVGEEQDSGQAIVAELKAKGIHFEAIPEDLPPGTLYTTPSDLVKNGATDYSLARLYQILKDETIPVSSHQVAGSTILTSGDLTGLRAYEQESKTKQRHGAWPGQQKHLQEPVSSSPEVTEFMTVRDAAELLGISQNAVLQLIYRGRLTATREEGGYRWLISDDEARNFQRAKPGPKPSR